MSKKKLAIGLSFFTTFGIFAYWVSVFTGVFPVVELIPGYVDWFMVFPLASPRRPENPVPSTTGWLPWKSLPAASLLRRSC